MKERHPIDDLFREGLYNSEAVPPAEVWERVVAQRSWGHRLLAGLQRRWAISLFALLLVGTPLAWYGVRSDAAPVAATSASTPAATPEERSTSLAAKQGDEDLGPNAGAQTLPDSLQESNVVHAAEHTQGADGIPAPNASSVPKQRSNVGPHSSTSDQDNVAIAGAGVNSRKTEEPELLTYERSGDKESGAGSVDEAAKTVTATSASIRPVAEVDALTAPSGSGKLVGSGTDDYFDMEFLLAHPHRIEYPRRLDSMLVNDRPVEAPYVLPNGAWWLGVQFGWNEWNGGWTGASPLVDELNQAEEWQSGWQAGVVGGRRWKSGFSVSLGLEVANARSRFLFNGAGNNDSDTGAYEFVLDTTWQVNAVAPDSSYVVYTYSFDLVAVPIGERGVRYSASNRYTLLNIPLEIAWQKNVKRFTFAPRLSLNAGLFIGRNGTTLENGSNVDTGPTTIPANDPRADDRFGMLLSGSAGMDLGYAITERIQLFAGPGYSTVLTSFGDNALRPSINGFTVRGRLVYEFGMMQRKARP